MLSCLDDCGIQLTVCYDIHLFAEVVVSITSQLHHSIVQYISLFIHMLSFVILRATSVWIPWVTEKEGRWGYTCAMDKLEIRYMKHTDIHILVHVCGPVLLFVHACKLHVHA